MRSTNRIAVLTSMTAALFAAFVVRGARAQDDAQPEEPPRVRVDLKANEVIIPARFVNPTQKLEVFACHQSGPTHETVVAFRSDGEAIYRALLEVGFRSPDRFWNAIGEDAVRRSLGDRAIVLLRWQWKGRSLEWPAERVIREADTGMALFVRGFTFAAEKRLMGDPPTLRVPPAVEVTIGDPNRQGSISSLLFHPNDLEALTPWMPPLEIEPVTLPDLAELVENDVPCFVVIRRVEREEELVAFMRSVHDSPRKKALHEQLEAIARRIDAGKATLAATLTRIGELLSEGEARGEAGREEIGSKLEPLVRRGRLEAALVYQEYIDLFDLQERSKAELVRTREDLDPEVRDEALARYAFGVAFEPRIARLEAAIARIDAGAQPPAASDEFERKALEAELEKLPLTRTHFWAQRHLSSVRRRIAGLDPDKEAYIRELLEEDAARTQGDMRAMRGRAALLASVAEEMRARGQEKWGEVEAEVMARRADAERQIELAELELKRVKLREDLRWLRNFAEDEGDSEEREAKRKALDAEAASCEAAIAKLKKALDEE